MVNLSPKLDVSFSNHKEFHLYYLTKHSNQWCKRMHLIGTIVGILGGVIGAVRMDPVMIGGAVVAGVAAALAGDVMFQKSTPTTFKHPIYSVISNFKMVKAMLTGDMNI